MERHRASYRRKNHWEMVLLKYSQWLLGCFLERGIWYSSLYYCHILLYSPWGHYCWLLWDGSRVTAMVERNFKFPVTTTRTEQWYFWVAGLCGLGYASCEMESSGKRPESLTGHVQFVILSFKGTGRQLERTLLAAWMKGMKKCQETLFLINLMQKGVLVQKPVAVSEGHSHI